MNFKRLLAFALLCASLAFGQSFQPAVQPHVTFVDGSGSPCVGCTLASYIAGTTTPTPTYTDSAGGGQNTNPIVLGTDGGAQIWLSNSVSYKFVLTDSLGTTVWTVDNVPGSQGFGVYLPLTGGTLTGPLIGTAATFSDIVTGLSFAGAGTGLTGTASSLSVGGTAGGLASGALGSVPYQSSAGATTFVGSPTTSGHTFVLSWQPSGAAIAPTVLDLGTYLASPPAIGGTAPAAGAFTTLNAATSFVLNGSQAFTGVQGTTGLNLAAATGSFTNGDFRSTDASGNEIDSGIAVPSATSTDQYIIGATACTPATSTDAGCTATQTITTQPDTTYSVSITMLSSAGAFLGAAMQSKGLSSISYSVFCAFNCGSYGTLTADIHVHHN